MLWCCEHLNKLSLAIKEKCRWAASQSDQLAIWAEVHGVERAFNASEKGMLFATCQIPKVEVAVPTRGGQQFAIGAKLQISNGETAARVYGS